MSESALVRDILLAFGGIHGVRLFRNNVGRLQDRHGHWVQYGLCVGSADLIGWHSGRFVALECKVRPRKPTLEQVAFLLAVDRAGGISGVVYSVEDAAAVLGVPVPSPPSRKSGLTNKASQRPTGDGHP